MRDRSVAAVAATVPGTDSFSLVSFRSVRPESPLASSTLGVTSCCNSSRERREVRNSITLCQSLLCARWCLSGFRFTSSCNKACKRSGGLTAFWQQRYTLQKAIKYLKGYQPPIVSCAPGFANCPLWVRCQFLLSHRIAISTATPGWGPHHRLWLLAGIRCRRQRERTVWCSGRGAPWTWCEPRGEVW